MAALINRWLSKVIFLRNDDVEITNSMFYINQISSKLILLSKINTITCFCSRWTCSIDKRTNSAKKHFIIIKSLCGCARGIPVPQTSRGVTHRGVSATHPVRHSMPHRVPQVTHPVWRNLMRSIVFLPLPRNSLYGSGFSQMRTIPTICYSNVDNPVQVCWSGWPTNQPRYFPPPRASCSSCPLCSHLKLQSTRSSPLCSHQKPLVRLLRVNTTLLKHPATIRRIWRNQLTHCPVSPPFGLDDKFR